MKKVYYINETLNIVIGLDKLSKLENNTKIVINNKGREINYSLNDIFNCREWNVYTLEDSSLNLDDIRELMKMVDKDSLLYEKLLKEEESLLNILVEDKTIELERTLF